MKKYNFNANEVTKSLINWIRDWFEVNGKGCNAVIGLSGGKDSTIVAALCVAALGADRVIGVAMPDGNQGLNEADDIANYLGIKFLVAPITELTTSLKRMFAINHTEGSWDFTMSPQSEQNVPPRARMMTLYAISQSNNGRVIGTCNYSESYLGYFTIYGDGASDVEPIGNLTVTELLQIGDVLGLPKQWTYKTPDDGLPMSTNDETKLGFTYATLDKYIRGIEMPDADIKKKIDTRHYANVFKLEKVKMFEHPQISVVDSITRMAFLNSK